MMAVTTEVDGYPLLSFPDVCVAEPKPGSVFCQEHFQLLEKHGVPTEKKDFLHYIGCKGRLSNGVYIRVVLKEFHLNKHWEMRP